VFIIKKGVIKDLTQTR